MFKSEARSRLIKDIILAVVAWLICGLVFAFATPLGGYGFLVAIACAGIPFGWRWLSKIITAISFTGIVIKFIGSIVLGWLAIFIILIMDIVNLVTAEDDVI